MYDYYYYSTLRVVLRPVAVFGPETMGSPGRWWLVLAAVVAAEPPQRYWFDVDVDGSEVTGSFAEGSDLWSQATDTILAHNLTLPREARACRDAAEAGERDACLVAFLARFLRAIFPRA